MFLYNFRIELFDKITSKNELLGNFCFFRGLVGWVYWNLKSGHSIIYLRVFSSKKKFYWWKVKSENKIYRYLKIKNKNLKIDAFRLLANLNLRELLEIPMRISLFNHIVVGSSEKAKLSSLPWMIIIECIIYIPPRTFEILATPLMYGDTEYIRNFRIFRSWLH